MGLTKSDVIIMSLATGLVVGNLYYCQPLTILIANEFKIPPHLAGQTSFFSQIGYAFGLLFLFPLGDKFERKKLLLFSTSIAVIALMIAAVSQSFIVLEIACFLIGFFSLAPQMVLALSVNLASPENKGKVLGTVMSGLLFGIVFSRILSGFIGQNYGWRAMFGLAAIICSIVLILIHYRFKESKTGFEGSYKNLLHSILILIKNEPTLRGCAAINFFVFIIYGSFWTTLVLLLSKAPYNFRTDQIGFFGIVGIVGAITAPIIGKWNDKGSERLIIGIGLVILLTSQIIFYFYSYQIMIFVIGIILLEIGQQSVRVSNQNVVLALIPTARNRLNTVLMTISFVGAASGASIGLTLWNINGWKTICIAEMIVVLVAGLFYFTTYKKPLVDKVD